MRLLVPGLMPGQDYGVQVRADNDGEKSGWSARFEFTAAEDETLPNAPTNVTWVVAGDAFYGEWDSVLYNVNDEYSYITRYELELVGKGIPQVVAVPQTTDSRPNYTLDFGTNVALFSGPSATVTLRVRAVDSKGLKSLWSEPIKTATNPPPAPVTDLVAYPIIDGVHMTWTAPADDDLIGYHIYAAAGPDEAGFDPDPQHFAGFSGSTYFTFVTSNYTEWQFIVRAVDKFYSESSIVRVSATPNSPFGVDVEAPPVPNIEDFSLTTNHEVPDATLWVEWSYDTPPADLSDFVLRYRTVGQTLWQSIIIPSTNDNLTLEAMIEHLTPYVNYEIRIAARDFAANQSDWSNIIVVDADGNVAPSKPATPVASANTMQIQVSHSGNRSTGAPMEGDVVEYEVYASTTNGFTTYDASTLLGKIPAGPAIVGTFPVPAESPSGDEQTWYIRVRAVDRGGLSSEASNQTTALVGLISSLNIAEATITSANIHSLEVSLLTAGSGIINDFTIKAALTLGDGVTDGIIQSWDFVDSGGTAGFRLADSGLIIKDGEIEASALKIQNSPNIMPAAYADFEYGDYYYTNAFWNVRGQGKLYVDAGITYDDQLPGSFKFGSRGLNWQSFGGNTAGTMWFGEHENHYNIDVEPGERLIYSIYINNTVSGSQEWFLRVKGNDTVTFLSHSITLPATAGWQRYQVPFTVPAGVTKLLMGLRKNTSTTPFAMCIDGAQVERVEAGLELASPWKPPAWTTISGAGITTGMLRSTGIINVNGTDQPMWSINLAGNAQFGDALVRGKVIVGPPTGTDNGNSFIASGNYVFNSTGWKVKDDGTAEFANITSRATNGTRTVISNAANPYQGGQQWNIISMYSTEPTWSPAQIWTNHIPGATSYGQMMLASPKLGASPPAMLKLSSFTNNMTVAELDALWLVSTADQYTFGSPTGQAIQFQMGPQIANATQRWRFLSPGGKAIVLRFGNLGVNDILSEGESGQRIRLDLYASDYMFNAASASGTIYMAGAPAMSNHPHFGSNTQNVGVTFSGGQFRITSTNGAAYGTVRGNLAAPSDMSYKTDVSETKPVLEDLKKLKVYEYNTPHGMPRKNSKRKQSKFKQRGLSAQEIQKVWPDAVNVDEDGQDMAVDIYYLLSSAVAAVQELSAKVDDLETKLALSSKK